MQFIDTHTHLFGEQFNLDIHLVVQNAIESGVSKFVIPHIDSQSTSTFLENCNKFSKNFFPLMGLHPTSVNTNYKKELDWVFDRFENQKTELVRQKYYGVGEIGIDLYWDKTFLPQQKDALLQQALFAKSNGLPIIIHARESFEAIFEVLDPIMDENLFGIFHCFTGNIQQANHILNYQTFYLGVGGVVTFKKSGLDETLSQIPLEKLVLETDSPYLAPTPYRGKRNESKYLILVAQKLAEIYSVSLQTIADITNKNAQQIFKFD